MRGGGGHPALLLLALVRRETVGLSPAASPPAIGDAELVVDVREVELHRLARRPRACAASWGVRSAPSATKPEDLSSLGQGGVRGRSGSGASRPAHVGAGPLRRRSDRSEGPRRPRPNHPPPWSRRRDRLLAANAASIASTSASSGTTTHFRSAWLCRALRTTATCSVLGVDLPGDQHVRACALDQLQRLVSVVVLRRTTVNVPEYTVPGSRSQADASEDQSSTAGLSPHRNENCRLKRPGAAIRGGPPRWRWRQARGQAKGCLVETEPLPQA